MLPRIRKIQRLLFNLTLSRNKSFKSENLLLLVKKTKLEEKTRFSFVISKKVVKKAHKRNLLKRRCFNVIKNEIYNIKNGFVCVFFIKKNISTLPYQKLNKEIVELLNKANTYKNTHSKPSPITTETIV